MAFYKSGNEVAEFDFEPSGNWEKITAKEGKRLQQEDACAKLREMLPPCSTVWTVLKRVGRSGMSREISVIVKTATGPRNVSWLVARAAGFRMSKGSDALSVGGCGMDMGFHVVYGLSSVLYRGGFGCVGKGCCSNDHGNGDRDYTPHYDGTPRDVSEVGKDLKPYSHYHKDGGYALRHSWL